MPRLFAHRAIRRLAVFALVAIPLGPCALEAQTGVPADTAKGVQIVLLGTAAGPPIRVERSEPASVLIVDGRRYLIDCGIGTIRRLARAHFASPTIRTIFFTHLHPDHALGLADLMSNDVFMLGNDSTRPTFDVYGPPQTAELVAAALEYVGISYRVFQAEDLPWTTDDAHFVGHDFSKDGVVYQDDEIRVIAAENTHYALMPAQLRSQMKSYALRFETPYGVVVFTGDTGPSDAVTELAEGADVLIPEATVADSTRAREGIMAAGARNHWTTEKTRIYAGHFTLEHLDQREIGEMATKAGVKGVLIHHFTPPNPAAYVAGVKKYFSGPVFAGADLTRYCLGGQSNGAPERTLEPCPLRK